MIKIRSFKLNRYNLAAFLWLLCLLITLVCFIYKLSKGPWLETNLQALLPTELSLTSEQVLADRIQEKRFNTQVIALVGAPSTQKAQQLAQEVTNLWGKEKLFTAVELQVNPNLSVLRDEIKKLRLATLPSNIEQQLVQQPQQYFQNYAKQILDPFLGQQLLPLEQDLLGLGRFVLEQARGESNLIWDSQSALLQITQDGITWILVRATLPEQSIFSPDLTLNELMTKSRTLVQQELGKFLVTGSTLFSADAKYKAEQESTIMTVLGVSSTLLLLLLVFRSLRVLLLFFPIVMGMLGGLTFTLLIFGQVHILTLVIGTSLVGVLIDFPLHWFASSLFSPRWVPQLAMKKLRFTFAVSLLVTLLGYALLAFTPLPILTQTAMFSIVSLIFAMLTTMLLLPYCFPISKSAPRSWLDKVRVLLQRLSEYSFSRLVKWLASLFILLGIWQVQWKDDIRQWVALEPQMLIQAQQIAKLTGINLGNQYFLVTAESERALWKNLNQLTSQLQVKGIAYQSLDKWLRSPEKQQILQQEINHLRSQDYTILEELGLPNTIVQDEIQQLNKQPLISLEDALQTSLGQSKAPLYLGHLDPHTLAAVVPVINGDDSLASLANGQYIFWQDKRSSLNQAFSHSRIQAAWLKLLSFVFAGLLLWKLFGWRQSIRIITAPLMGIIATVGLLGWFGLPIGLFSLFGLLLVSAIGIDYSAYMQSAKEPLSYKRIAISLAALTTLISFVLLGISSTPAIASFGITVTLGVALSVFFTLRLFRL